MGDILARHLDGQGLLAQARVGRCRLVQPLGQGRQGGGGQQSRCRRHLQRVDRPAGGVRQGALGDLQIHLGCKHLRIDATGARSGFVGVGNGSIPQFKAVLCLHQCLVHGRLLALQQAQCVLRQRHGKVALGGLQHEGLFGSLPLHIGQIGRQRELAALRRAFGAVDGHAGTNAPARPRAVVHRRVERHI